MGKWAAEMLGKLADCEVNGALEAAVAKVDFYAKVGDGLPWNTVEECEAANKAARYVAREIADAIRAMKREIE